MDVIDSVCEVCAFRNFRKGATRGVMDCDPDEYSCEYESDNFMTEDGCYRFERWEE